MDSDKPDLGRVRVQTARMLEIYALLRGELDGGGLRLTPAMREQLTQAIWTIAGNMKELQEYLAATREDSSARASESTPVEAVGSVDSDPAGPGEDEDLEGLLKTVLKWVTEMEAGG